MSRMQCVMPMARVQLRRLDNRILIEVADNGPGIPVPELEKVFEPFYRLEASRNRATGGTGLGLASARAVARSHGGDVTLANRRERGLVATITLPLH
ncbi:ATP-binding protein [Mesorhizobium sp. B4-1-1]|nr:ATP-binding protein [Mesorhizobium sp. B4-1-1]